MKVSIGSVWHPRRDLWTWKITNDGGGLVERAERTDYPSIARAKEAGMRRLEEIEKETKA